RCLALLQLDGRRLLESGELLRRQHRANGLHVAGQAGDGQERPAVAAGDVVQAAVVLRRLVEANPASEMSHRPGARPVRIVLVPGDDAAVPGRLAEELIVPE